MKGQIISVMSLTINGLCLVVLLPPRVSSRVILRNIEDRPGNGDSPTSDVLEPAKHEGKEERSSRQRRVSLDDLNTLKDIANTFRPQGTISANGRDIMYHCKGRFHSFTEPWVYDCTAQDVETGVEVEVSHFKEWQDGVDEAVKELFEELKAKGFLKKPTIPPEVITREALILTSTAKDKTVSSAQRKSSEADISPTSSTSSSSVTRLPISAVSGWTPVITRAPSDAAPLPLYSIILVSAAGVLIVISVVYAVCQKSKPCISFRTAVVSKLRLIRIKLTPETAGGHSRLENEEDLDVRIEVPGGFNGPDCNENNPISAELHPTLAENPSGASEDDPPISELDDLTKATAKTSCVGGKEDKHETDVCPDENGSYKRFVVKQATPTACQLDQNENYMMHISRKKGLVLIVNNINRVSHPLDESSCKGSKVDVANLDHVFQQLGFEPVYYESLSSDKIRTSLDSLVERITSEGAIFHSAVAMVFMTRGKQAGVVGTDDQIVPLDEIVDRMNDSHCPAMAEKPKMMFIQAIGNGDDDCGATVMESESEMLDFPLSERVELSITSGRNEGLSARGDEFVTLATSDGYFSIRDNVNGSWFIQEMCEELISKAHVEDLNTMMNRVSMRVNAFTASVSKDKGKPTMLQSVRVSTRGARKSIRLMPKYPPTFD